MSEDRAIAQLVESLGRAAPSRHALDRQRIVAGPRRRRRLEGPILAAVYFGMVTLVGIAGFLGRSGPRPLGTDGMTGHPVSVETATGTWRGTLEVGDQTGFVVTPGYGESVAEMEAFVAALTARGHSVIALDLPGAGDSTGSGSVAELPDGLIRAADSLRAAGAERVVLVGVRHSATAGVVAAAADPLAFDGLVALFPFPQYQGLDATDAADGIAVPMLFVGMGEDGTLPAEGWAFDLHDRSGQAELVLLGPGDPSRAIIDQYGAQLVELTTGFATALEG